MQMMKLGRPLEFDPEEALAAATRVFWIKGYEATSTKDLMDAMGLSKSSLYQTFGSKKQLFMRALAHYCNASTKRERAKLNGQMPDKEFVVAMLRDLGDPDRYPEDPRGCLLVNSTIELGKRDQEVGAFVDERAKMSLAMFEGVIRRAQEEGEISPDKSAAGLAGMLVVSVHGLKAMSRLNVDKAVLQSAVEEIINRLE